MKSVKTGKRIRAIGLSLAVLCCMGSVAGCQKSNPDSETDLQIHMWQSGLGLEFMNRAIADFKEEYPQYNVIFDYTPSAGTFDATISTGPEDNSIDLYLHTKGSGLSPDFYEFLEPLDDILTSKSNEDDELTIGERMSESMLEGFKGLDGKYYSLPYVESYTGIVYNADVIDGEVYKVPRTTTELQVLTTNLVKDGKIPYIHFADFNGGYWGNLFHVWQAQYDGLDNFMNELQKGTLTDANGFYYPSEERMTQSDGRLKAIEVFRNIISSDTVAPASNTETYTGAQTRFLDGEAVMMANGTWLLNEMKGIGLTPNIRMMKTPVISSIRDKTPSVESEAELRALIDAIDAVGGLDPKAVPLTGEGYEVTETDRDRIFEARNLVTANSNDNVFSIPKYASAKQAAKDFIKFFYSDKNLQNYGDITKMQLPLSLGNGDRIETNGWTQFNKDFLDYRENRIAILTGPSYLSRFFTVGAASLYGDIMFVKDFASQGNTTDAKAKWDEIVAAIHSKYSNWISDAAISV